MRWLAIAILAMAAPAFAQQAGSGSGTIIQLPTDSAAPVVSAAASPSDVKLGARFTVFVTATYGDGVEVNLREPVALGGAFEVKRRVSEDRVANGQHVREWQLEVYAWELGDLAVPPIAVTFTAFGRAGQVETNAVPVRVTGVLGDVDDPKLMRDSAPPVTLASRDWFWAWIGGGAVIGVVIAALWLRRRRRRRVVRLVGGLVGPTVRRIDMTSERALERLLAIEQSSVLDDDARRKLGYADIADVIREYLGMRYRVGTFDLTSAELLRALARAATAADRALVATWLERCDLVKYGGARATVAEARDLVASARALVTATTPQIGKAA